MALLEENVKQQVREMFRKLQEPVKIVVFTQESLLTLPTPECPSCKDNRLLMGEIASLSDKISITVYDYMKDKDKAEQYKVDKIPATIIEGKKDFGIRFFGLPAGYEFPALLNAIKAVSSNSSELSDVTKEKLKTLVKPVHIQVFVTLTCPYCSSAVAMGHRMALESDLVRADMINAQDFPQLTQKYSVNAVPKVIVNENVQFEGALPEDQYLQKVVEAAV